MKETGEAYLPEGVLVEIIKRLPVKSLLRFRCVSKSWYSLITSPEFVTLHRNHNIINNPRLMLDCVDDFYHIHCDNDRFEFHSVVEFPIHDILDYKYDRLCYQIVGSCHGLFCVRHGSSPLHLECTGWHEEHLCLWNPSIQKVMPLPMPGITYPDRYNLVFGLGFDSKSNDYKLVRIVDRRVRDGCEMALPEAELCELGTGAWRGICSVVPPYMIRSNSSQANVNGALHWFAFERTEVGELPSLIVAFDLSDEVFKEIRLPNTVARIINPTIAACGEFLSLFECCSSSSGYVCTVWVMKKYGVYNSWTKLFNVKFSQLVYAVLGFRKNGELLVVTEEEDGELVSLNPYDNQATDLGIKGILPHSVYTCIESLMLLDPWGMIQVWDCLERTVNPRTVNDPRCLRLNLLF